MVYLDEDLATHPKIYRAGALLNGDPQGSAMALALYVHGLSYAKKYATDGFLPDLFLDRSAIVSPAKPVAEALANPSVNLWERVDGGYRIHDYLDWNDKASDIKRKRAKDRRRKRIERAGNGDASARTSHGQTAETLRTSRARPSTTTTTTTVPGSTQNQPKRSAISPLVPTSQNLPPRLRATEPTRSGGTDGTGPLDPADRVRATLRDRAGRDHGGSLGRCGGVESRGEGPDPRPRPRIPETARIDRGDRRGRTRDVPVVGPAASAGSAAPRRGPGAPAGGAGPAHWIALAIAPHASAGGCRVVLGDRGPDRGTGPHGLPGHVPPRGPQRDPESLSTARGPRGDRAGAATRRGGEIATGAAPVPGGDLAHGDPRRGVPGPRRETPGDLAHVARGRAA